MTLSAVWSVLSAFLFASCLSLLLLLKGTCFLLMVGEVVVVQGIAANFCLEQHCFLLRLRVSKDKCSNPTNSGFNLKRMPAAMLFNQRPALTAHSWQLWKWRFGPVKEPAENRARYSFIMLYFAFLQNNFYWHNSTAGDPRWSLLSLPLCQSLSHRHPEVRHPQPSTTTL